MLKQKFEAVGRLVVKPEMRYTPKGTAVANARVAIEDGYFDKDTNQWESRTIWATLVFWGNSAEAIAQKGDKGDQIVFIGSLVYDAKTGAPNVFERSDGTAGAKFEFRVNEFQIFAKAGKAEAAPASEDMEGAGPDTTEEIPF